jgi:hypothetical protein
MQWMQSTQNPKQYPPLVLSGVFNLSLILIEVQNHWSKGVVMKARPANIVPSTWKFSDSTVITQSVKFN